MHLSARLLSRPRSAPSRTVSARSSCPFERTDILLREAPLDDFRESFAQRRVSTEAEQPFGLVDTADPVRDEALLLTTVLGLEIRAGELEQDLDQLVDGGAYAHADVEELVGAVCLHAEDVRLGGVANVDEVVHLRAVAEDYGTLAGPDLVQHTHDDAHVSALVVHPRRVDVHVAVTDKGKPVLLLLRTQRLLVGVLRGSVGRAVV